MKARFKYSNGYMLLIPKYGNALMLFMEYVANFNAEINWMHKVNNSEDFFEVRLNLNKTQYKSIVEYINNNL